jgi:ABC-type amino acid transport system permease subunit
MKIILSEPRRAFVFMESTLFMAGALMLIVSLVLFIIFKTAGKLDGEAIRHFGTMAFVGLIFCILPFFFSLLDRWLEKKISRKKP